jgi:hypothetical protein
MERQNLCCGTHWVRACLGPGFFIGAAVGRAQQGLEFSFDSQPSNWQYREKILGTPLKLAGIFMPLAACPTFTGVKLVYP